MGKICAVVILWLLCFAPVRAQSPYASELWAAYNKAADFTDKKEAFIKLEKYYSAYHLDSAMLICKKFRDLAAQSQPDYVPFVDLRIASTYTRQLEFEKAGNILIPLLEKAERERNDSLRPSTLLNLAKLSKAQKNLPVALQRAFEAAKLHDRLHNWRDLCADYNTISSIYSINQSDSTLLFCQKTISIAEQHDLPEVLATTYNSLGVYFHRKSDWDQAIEFYKKSAFYGKKVDDRFGLCFTLLNIGHAYRKQQKWTEAKPWYDEAMPICESCGNVEGVGSIQLGLAEMYEAQGDYKSALAAQRKLGEVNVQKNEQVYNRATQTLEAKYGSEKKERELGQQRAENFQQRVALFSLLATLLAGLVLAYLFYNRYRLRKKAELDAAIIREQQLGLSAVIEAQEAERKRIARDLHDGIAQELVALKLGFDALGRRVVKVVPEEASNFAELGGQIDSSCTEVRSIAHVMSPPVLEQQGLAPSLEQLLRHTLAHAELEANFHAHDLPLQLDEKTEIGLYRITQELLNNIVKHARAAKVIIELFQAENQLVLRVEDDGIGFDFDTVRSRGTMGVLNILSRVSTLGGEFFSERKLPHGTVSLVRVPV
ncbi:MAG: sensor histidine kinase [Phycisphaerae bacterium]|nr:sensor histidine kinase [Saprospiraceae bacterium]